MILTLKVNRYEMAKKWQTNNFKVEIGGMPCRRVTSVQGFTIKQSIKPAASKMVLACPEGALKSVPAEFKGRTFRAARVKLKGSVVYRDLTLNKALMKLPFRVVSGRTLGQRHGRTMFELQVAPIR